MNKISHSRLIARLHDLDPYEFEHLIADLWRQSGWEATVSDKTNDRGVDVVARTEVGFPIKVVIQAKRYTADNKVGPSELREYGSIGRQENADIAIVVTTSRFTRQAQEIASDIGVKIVDIDDLIQWIEEWATEDILLKYSLFSEPELANDSDETSAEYESLSNDEIDPYVATAADEIAIKGFLAGTIIYSIGSISYLGDGSLLGAFLGFIGIIIFFLSIVEYAPDYTSDSNKAWYILISLLSGPLSFVAGLVYYIKEIDGVRETSN